MKIKLALNSTTIDEESEIVYVAKGESETLQHIQRRVQDCVKRLEQRGYKFDSEDLKSIHLVQALLKTGGNQTILQDIQKMFQEHIVQKSYDFECKGSCLKKDQILQGLFHPETEYMTYEANGKTYPSALVKLDQEKRVLIPSSDFTGQLTEDDKAYLETRKCYSIYDPESRQVRSLRPVTPILPALVAGQAVQNAQNAQKSNSGMNWNWLWILLVLILVGALGVYIVRR